MHQGRLEAVATGLGWFSIALGVAELAAPRAVGRILSIENPRLVQACGAREIATGIAILFAGKRAPWIWARVAGDAVDIAAARRPAARAALAGVTAVDFATAAALTREENRPPRPLFDYSDRSGFPKPAEQMRGAAVRAKPPSPRSPEPARYT